MIDARELRIGNLINANGVQIAVDIINVDFGFPENYLINDWYEEDLEPIPLTEEWLLRFGFERCSSPYKDADAFQIGKDGDRLIWCNNELYKPLSEGFVRITNSKYPIDDYPVRYIYQLQNLIFALTGKELTIQHL